MMSGPRTLRRLAAALLAALLIAAPGLAAQASAEAPGAAPSREYQVKAAVLYNFAKFTRWPEGAFAGPDSPCRICVLGKDPFGAALDSLVGKKIGGRPVVISRFAEPDGAEQCDLLYISASERDRLVPLLKRFQALPVLLVSELPDFARRGGIVNLRTVDQRVRFAINVRVARLAGFEFSAQLLKLAEVLSTPPTMDLIGQIRPSDD